MAMEKKKSSSMALFFDEEEYEFLEISEDDEQDPGLSLSHWEFISASDFDFEEEPKPEKSEPQDPEFEDKDHQIEPPQVLHFLNHGHHDRHADHDDHEDDDDGYGDHDDGDDAYGLDDELVPWSVGGKFGRQRMRKLGKRGFPKMYNSKRSPYLFMRPGVVRGKHGLGLKHSL
ncbi:hypothetical protein TIFTF001_024876 [Ficus carica]|uniref:Uncharacterized protein n=1 Tax=Ficus carica TaxID=3494 RepID=A0AA88DF47_FICCA|nr:hypothetical protein TIFTF001_024876 [Ficus carica]